MVWLLCYFLLSRSRKGREGWKGEEQERERKKNEAVCLCVWESSFFFGDTRNVGSRLVFEPWIRWS